jgi:lysophospholipase L1-like esterase
MIREKGVVCNVTNFGGSGYVSMQELIALELQLRQGNVPDLVVFYDGVNDTYAAWQQGAAGVPQNEQTRVLEFNLSNPKRRAERTTRLLQEYAARLALRRFAMSIAGKVGPKRAGTPAVPAASLAADDSLAQDVVDTYLGHIELVRALADRYGFQCLFFWQPTLFEKRHLSPSELSQANLMKSEGEFFRRTYDVVRRSNLEEKSGDRFRDMSTMFTDVREPIYFDFCHMGETGYEEVAAAMVDDVMKVLPARALPLRK